MCTSILCNSCATYKDSDEFYRNHSESETKESICKKCLIDRIIDIVGTLLDQFL